MAGDGGRASGSRRRVRGDAIPPIAPATHGSPEAVVARMHSSARWLVLPAIAVIAVCATTGYVWGNLPETWENAALPYAAAFLVIVLGVLPFLAWASRVYLITTRRIVMTRGFLRRRREEFPHHRSGEVTVRRGPLQKIAGSGDVVVAVRQGQTFVMRDVPSALLVRSAVLDLMMHGSGNTPPRSRQPSATRRPFDP